MGHRCCGPGADALSCVRQVQQIGHGESAAVHSGQLEQHPFVRSAGPSLRPDLPPGRAPRAAAVKDAAANAAAPAEPARSVLCVGHVRQFWGCKSPVQPDGGEALAKRKGRTARDRLKEAWSKVATRRTETGYEAALVGRAGRMSRSPYPSKARAVNPAGVR